MQSGLSTATDFGFQVSEISFNGGSMHPYYKKRERKLHKEYAHMNDWAAEVLTKYYEPTVVESLMEEVTQECSGIIDRMPYIGGDKNAYTPIIEIVGWGIALQKVLKRHGFIPEVAGYLNRTVFARYCEELPRFLWKPMGWFMLSRFANWYLNRQAEQSQLRLYPEDFVYTFSPDPEGHGYTLDFSECAVHKYYVAEGVPELQKFCNYGDPIYSTMFGMGCDATHTFATQTDRCLLTFKRGRETVTPDNILKMIERAEEYLQQDKVSLD